MLFSDVVCVAGAAHRGHLLVDCPAKPLGGRRGAFQSWLWPVLGLLFVPFTTLMYVAVAPGGVAGWDWLWIGLAVLADIASYSGGGYGNRNRIPGYSAK